MEDDRVFAGILSDCLDAIDAGQASIEDCLTRYPQHAARLEELLRLSSEVRMMPLPTPTPEMLKAGERRLVQAARSKAADGLGEQRERGLLRTLPKWFAPVAAASAGLAMLFICVLVVLLGAGTAWRTFRHDDATLERPTAAISKREEGQVVPSLPTPTFVAGVTQEREESQDVPSLPTPTPASDVAQDVSPLPSPTEVPAPDGSSKMTHTVYLPLSIKPMPPHMAMLKDVQGIVEVQTDGETWSAVNVHQSVEAGQRVRTGALSSASLGFYDGSIAHLGPGTEISVNYLGKEPSDGSRIVELSQWVGETDHDVASAYGDNARYEVHTPSGTGEAKGTFFHVSVTPARVVRFGVDEGAVAVTHLDVTVIVVAGQLTTVHVDRPPSKPVFRVTGEGEVEATGPTWRIAGQNFRTHDATVIVGNPQVGDWVHVDGHLLADGTRVADRIVLLRRAPANRFTISGEVEATGTLTWTVAGQTIVVDEATEIDEGIQVGDRVRVDGVIDGPTGGTLLAESIHLIDERGVAFSFVGVVEEIAETYWRVSGISVTIDAETVIDDDLVVGDIVRVRGVFLGLEGGIWLARSIAPIVQEGPRFAFTGEVEAIGTVTWTVAGQEIVVNDETEIDQDIQVGDRVRVEGIIDESGALLAESIHLIATPTLSFVFVGKVEEIAEEYWMISGISVTVDAETVIDDGLAVGDMVRVRGRMMADGTWQARSIRRLVPEEHKFEFVGLVEHINPWMVSGIAIETRMWTEIKDEIEVGDRVKVEGRILPDGTWLAEEIKLADGDEDLSFEFVGTVEGIKPWVVSGISLTVNYRTEIKDEIGVGDRVKVEGRILPSGKWLATEIKLAGRRLGRGCMQFTSLVVQIGAGQIVLQNGTTIPVDGSVQIEGEIQVNSVILFYLCVGEDGEMTITTIIVIAYIEPVIIVQPTPPPTQPPPTQPPPPPSGGSPIVVNDNNRTQTFTCNGHSVTVNGNDNTITLLGSCGPVTIRGNNNWVSIQSATSVTNTGNNNTIVGP